MTEDEAKTRHCPMSLERNCIGSKCMAWRWLESAEYWTQAEGETIDLLKKDISKRQEQGYQLVRKVDFDQLSKSKMAYCPPAVPVYSVSMKMPAVNRQGQCGIGTVSGYWP